MHLRSSFRIGVAALALIGVLAGPVQAHHGWAGNSDEELELTGTVQKGVSLAGPHATMKILAKGQVWDVTLAPAARTMKSQTALLQAFLTMVKRKWRCSLPW